MRMKSILLFSLFIIIVAAGFSFAGKNDMKSHKMETMSTARVGEEAPDFTLVDANGDKQSLSDFKDKNVVLEWINFGCPFVQKHYATGNMQKLQKNYTDKGVIWLTICSSAPGKQGYFTGEELQSKIKEAEIQSTAYLIDADGTVGKMYGAKTTPDMYVINPEGTLIYSGAIDDKPTYKHDDIKGAENYVVMALNASMNGKSVQTKMTPSYGCSVKY